ncbi:MAG: efflux transporter periplasmic adaptor subunit [Salinivirgaceae bacterium]|nr:MAG: efflux transporter periplasmic adaptor subunit [Salinivirgaceae bacterium]
MDIVIEKKKGIKRKHIYYAIGTVFFLIIAYNIFFAKNVSTYSVDKDKISISTVQNSVFNDYITVSGNVEPIATIYLDAMEGGRVEERIVEEGAMLKKGDVILRLSNPDLNLSILNSEAQLAEKSNFLRNTMVVLEQEKLQIQSELLRLRYEIKRKKRKLDQNTALYRDSLISQEEYLLSEEDYNMSQSSFDLYIKRQAHDSIYRSIQVHQMEDNLRNMDLNLKLVRQRKENLNVTSPIDGQLTVLDAEVGQSIPKNSRIGQIDILSSYKVVAPIDEHYIDKVKKGLIAILERQGEEYELKIRKVFPDVRNGKFIVEMIFTGHTPENMRTGQTYYSRLQLGNPQDALLLEKGSFFQETGGQWIFVVSEDGQYAEKRAIKIGRQNPKYYEVIEGLEAGEKVIISGYSNFGDNEKLDLN